MSLRPLLIVEDDQALQKQMRWSFDQFEILAAGDRESALALVRRHLPPVVTMDLGLPPDPDSVSEGFALLGEILAAAPDTSMCVRNPAGRFFNSRSKPIAPPSSIA